MKHASNCIVSTNLYWHQGRTAALGYDHGCLGVDYRYTFRMSKINGLRLQFWHLERVIDIRLGKFTFNLEPVACHVHFQGRIRYSLSSRLIVQSFFFGLVD